MQADRQTDVHTSIHLYIHHRYILCIGPWFSMPWNSQVQSPLVKDDRWWRASSVPRLKLAQHFHCWEPQSPALSYWAGNGWEWMGMGLLFIVMDWIIPHSLLSTSKLLKALFSVFNVSFLINSWIVLFKCSKSLKSHYLCLILDWSYVYPVKFRFVADEVITVAGQIPFV